MKEGQIKIDVRVRPKENGETPENIWLLSKEVKEEFLEMLREVGITDVDESYSFEDPWYINFLEEE